MFLCDENQSSYTDLRFPGKFISRRILTNENVRFLDIEWLWQFVFLFVMSEKEIYPNCIILLTFLIQQS